MFVEEGGRAVDWRAVGTQQLVRVAYLRHASRLHDHPLLQTLVRYAAIIHITLPLMFPFGNPFATNLLKQR
ncbi:hypothetical protein Slin_5289 [Spirosoma linguale DSM 74]|uniref:Uncharacterized protein n=1 Tax=Spirosoma linguale (strain ATCC 33905 / DSM 74 / LMG 10896 / Claus 1) TaxID=504472 RepID=D2QE42_SPILD|nr:hypothetical protein Slin_5289 [Spirosoma linguale DSM 74]